MPPTSRRRALRALFGLLPPVAPAMAQGGLARIGLVTLATRQQARILSYLSAGLEAAGLRIGERVELHAVAGSSAELPGLVRQLLRRAPQLVIVTGSEAAMAVHQATFAVPMIVLGPDPTALGLTDSLARPRVNLTGVTILSSELDAKRLQLMAELLPDGARFAALVASETPLAGPLRDALHQTARQLGRELVVFSVQDASNAAVFAQLAASDVAAVLITANPSFSAQAENLGRLAQEHRLPLVCQWREMAEAGCVLSYGPSLRAAYRRVAEMAALILRGVPAHDLPIERPVRFELVLNLRVARQLGLDPSPLPLARADDVIE